MLEIFFIQRLSQWPPHMGKCSAMLVRATVLAMPWCYSPMQRGESAQEKQKGAEQITSIATYLPYVGGSSVAPTPNCNICICISIKDRDPSDLDLKINIASAFGVPSLCKAPDDFSQCPCEFLSVPLLVGSFHFYRWMLPWSAIYHS